MLEPEIKVFLSMEEPLQGIYETIEEFLVFILCLIIVIGTNQFLQIGKDIFRRHLLQRISIRKYIRRFGVAMIIRSKFFQDWQKARLPIILPRHGMIVFTVEGGAIPAAADTVRHRDNPLHRRLRIMMAGSEIDKTIIEPPVCLVQFSR